MHRMRSDDGAAVVDFVLISVLLVFLLFAILQVAVYAYARNVVAAAAADGARYGAAAGADPGDGARRAVVLIRSALNAANAAAIPCAGTTSTDEASGLAVTTVHCRGRLPTLFLPLHLPLRIDVTSSALQEARP